VTRRIQVGVFGAPHGVRGELRLKSHTGDPLAIGDYGPLSDDAGRRFELTALRPVKDDILVVRVKGVADRAAAAALTHVKLFVDRAALPDADDEEEFYHADLIGLRAETQDGAPVGTVVAVHNHGAGDILEIAPDAGETLLLPFTRAVAPVVDVAGGRIVVAPPAEIEVREEES
jgi:16S rRNA processing protein RimM